MKSTPAGFPKWYPGWLLPIEQRFWRLHRIARYPRISYYDWRKWRSRPKVGDLVEDCRCKIVRVAKIGSDGDHLIFEDGHSASWMSCCDWPAEGGNGKAE